MGASGLSATSPANKACSACAASWRTKCFKRKLQVDYIKSYAGGRWLKQCLGRWPWWEF